MPLTRRPPASSVVPQQLVRLRGSARIAPQRREKLQGRLLSDEPRPDQLRRFFLSPVSVSHRKALELKLRRGLARHLPSTGRLHRIASFKKRARVARQGRTVDRPSREFGNASIRQGARLSAASCRDGCGCRGWVDNYEVDDPLSLSLALCSTSHARKPGNECEFRHWKGTKPKRDFSRNDLRTYVNNDCRPSFKLLAGCRSSLS